MLEGQVEKVLVLEDTVRHSPMPSPAHPVKPPSAQRQAVLSQSQTSLLNRLEEEAGEVMRSLASPPKGGGIGISDLDTGDPGQFAERIDEKVRRASAIYNKNNTPTPTAHPLFSHRC